MTTTTETVPLSAFLEEFDRESEALREVLSTPTAREDDAPVDSCVDCQVEEAISLALDPTATPADSLRTEALFTPSASITSPNCTCDQSPDAPCSETCVSPGCVAAVIHARMGG